MIDTRWERTFKVSGSVLTVGDLRLLLGMAAYAPDCVVVNIEIVEPLRPSETGMPTVSVSVTLPVEDDR